METKAPTAPAPLIALVDYMGLIPENDIGGADTSSVTLIRVGQSRLELTSRQNVRLVRVYSNFPQRGVTLEARGIRLSELPSNLQAAVHGLK